MEEATEPTFLLKNHLDEQAIQQIANLVLQQDLSFPAKRFIKQASAPLSSLTLKQRVNHITDVLATCLSPCYQTNVYLLIKLAQYWHSDHEQHNWQSYRAWPLIEYVGRYGMHQPDIALESLKCLTSLFTAEFAIRPYIEKHFELTYSHLLKWCQAEDPHIRRLASESLRSRLPWGKHLSFLKGDPEPVLALLERLKDDSSRYVQKSVANNLNDISKDHPQRVIEVCKQWQLNATPQRHWIINHGLRSLIKEGYPAAFDALGFKKLINVASDFQLKNMIVKLGESTQLQVTLTSLSAEPQDVILDYRIWHMKANGLKTAKVFKWKILRLAPNATLYLTKNHHFKPLTTRRYYHGMQDVEIMLNGRVFARSTLKLIV